MNLDLPLSEDELDELDVFLMSEAVPEDGMEMSTLDGFLAAIVPNPQVILPSQWLPWVWDMENGEASREFTDAQHANRIIGLLMRPLRRDAPKVGRNDPCPCGSGKTFRRCCGDVAKMH